MAPNALSVTECIKFGWNRFKAKPWTYVAAVLIIAIIQVAIGGIQGELPEESSALLLGFLVSTVISTFLSCGIIHFFLKAHDREGDVKLEYLWHPKPFWRYLLASILTTIIVFIGFVVLVIPGIYLSLALFFVLYLVVDTELGPIGAIKRSFVITRGNRWKLLLLFLAVMGITIIGMIPFFLGLLVTGPVLIFAFTHAYRLLSDSAGSVSVPETPTAS